MSENQEEWSTIEIDGVEKKKPVEFEVEGEETKEEPVQAATEQKEESTYVEQIQESLEPEKVENKEKPVKELEGIETKGAEKRIRQLIRQRKERDEKLQKMEERLSTLQNELNQKEEQLSNSLKSSIDNSESQLNSNLEAAKSIYRQAIENSDVDAQIAAQESISKAYAELNQISNQRTALENYSTQAEQSQVSQPQQQTPKYDPKAVDWAAKNNWFGKDQIMTTAALSIDQELKDEGYDPSDDDFYEEIDNRLRSRYPQRFQDTSAQEPETPRLQDTPSNSAQVVAGASRTPKTSKGNKVKLTQEDVRLANKWGISLEQYAAEKLKVEKAEGDYTSIFN
tara:strand:- start:1032 stop:2051 length:1020 start_codon:yes stop_codon:yes gene_type:complete